MSKYLANVRIVEIPKFRAVSSGYVEHEKIFDVLGEWMFNPANSNKLKKSLYCAVDFMWHENDKTIWIAPIEDWVTEADVAPHEIIEFEGGLYVVSTANENDPDDRKHVGSDMVKWVEESGVFEMDFRPSHVGMAVPIPSKSDIINKTLGYEQQEIFYPIKLRIK